jgi:hypothetical protein
MVGSPLDTTQSGMIIIGVLYGTAKRDFGVSVGKWHIPPDGHVYRMWHVGDNRRERCYAVYPEGATFVL